MFPVEEVHVSNDSELSTLQEDVADLESQMSGIIQIERITGEVIMFGGTEASVPVGWVLCDGQGLSTTTFADLFAVIGYEYGGSGGTFKVPDYQSNNKFPKRGI